MNAIFKEIVSSTEPPVVVVGTGPVGVQFCQEFTRLSPNTEVVLYGDEPWEPYNRVQLSTLLSGEVVEQAISNRASIEKIPSLDIRYHTRVIEIDESTKTVIDDKGNVQPYSKLIIATGASPRIPSIDGVKKSGVYTFRSMGDVQNLKARQVRSRHVVVLGGGLLGLESARAMRTFNTHVTVIEHNTHLLFRQLDPTSAEMLREHVMSQGIEMLFRESIKSINGDESLESITLRSGREIKCDTLILATGILPNISLAKATGIAVGKGIKVDEKMTTSKENIYAIGECVEFNQRTYGTVSPGYEQASIVANNLSGNDAIYVDSLSASRLKVIDCAVFSLGDVEESHRQFTTYTYTDEKIYRRLNISRGKVIGVIAIGPWKELGRVQEAVNNERRLMPWQWLRFERTGNIWGEEDLSVTSWPAQAVVCNCTGVSCGQIREAIKSGCENVGDISAQTGASSVCGTCKPLIAEMVGDRTPQEPERGHKPLIIASIICFFLAVITTLSPRVEIPQSVQVAYDWGLLWTDSLIKQYSGFTLLGLSVIAAILSLRKRLKWVSFGEFTGWRVVHVLVGVFILLGLFVHTGFRLGSNLNFWLMFSYSGMLISGAVIGVVIAAQHKMRATQVKQVRAPFFWVHILLFWPLPVLLTFHVLKSYYF